jgi:hypothetical protein
MCSRRDHAPSSHQNFFIITILVYIRIARQLVLSASPIATNTIFAVCNHGVDVGADATSVLRSGEDRLSGPIISGVVMLENQFPEYGIFHGTWVVRAVKCLAAKKLWTSSTTKARI